MDNRVPSNTPERVGPKDRTDPRMDNTRSSNFPGQGPGDTCLRFGGENQQPGGSIRSVRVGDVHNYGSGELGPMELAGKTVSPPKVPAMVKYDSRPIEDAGPLEMQQLEQQKRNAIALGDVDYAPLRDLDYEHTINRNLTPSGKSAQRRDRDF